MIKVSTLIIASLLFAEVSADDLSAEMMAPSSKEGNAAVEELRARLNARGIAANAMSCKKLVMIYGEHGGSFSYGGLCTLRGHDVLVCDDVMVGGMLTFSYNATIYSDPVTFAKAHCSPGG